MLTIDEHLKLIQAENNSLQEAFHSAQEAASKKNKKLNAIVRFFDEGQYDFSSIKEKSAYAGLPILIKDNILLKGNIASC